MPLGRLLAHPQSSRPTLRPQFPHLSNGHKRASLARPSGEIKGIKWLPHGEFSGKPAILTSWWKLFSKNGLTLQART